MNVFYYLVKNVMDFNRRNSNLSILELQLEDDDVEKGKVAKDDYSRILLTKCYLLPILQISIGTLKACAIK